MLYYNEEGVKEAVTLCWISTVIKNKTDELLRKEDVHTRRLLKLFFEQMKATHIIG